MAIDWESVNGPPEENKYDFRKFDLPKGSHMQKDGKSIHVY